MKRMNKLISCLVVIILLSNPVCVLAMTKSETIYSNLSYNGTVEKTTINNEIRNIPKGEVLDYTKLENIRNLNGDEKFTLGNNVLTWKSNGKDIYYQGELKEALPIGVSATYYLNGKEMKPKDMLKKKGNVEIRIRFTNRDYNNEESLYIPYVISTTSIISNKYNSNFNITSGKCISTGKDTVVSAISSPGLYENTNIDEFRDLDHVTISYDTENFENIDIYFAITPKLIDEIDLSKLDKLDNIKDSLNQLQDGMNQIESGSYKLAEGNKALADKYSKMTAGMGNLSNGMNQLDSSLQSINGTINDITTTVNVLNSILESEQGTGITVTPEQYNMLPESVRNTLAQLIGLYQINSDTLIRLKELNLSLAATYELYGLDRDEATIKGELINNLDENTISILLNTKKLYETSYEPNEHLIEMITNLLNEILRGENGIITILVNYVNTINDYSNQLADGSAKINYGLSEMYDNSVKVSNALYGVTDATYTLSNGISKINREGINKLTSMGNDIYNYSNKAKKLVKLTNDYNGFSADNVNQTVFVYKLSTK